MARVLVTVLLLAALYVLGHGPWHVPLVAIGNGVTAFFTGAR